MVPAEDKSTVWVPVCCGRIMRFNMFRQPGGGAYGALLCSSCSKNIVLEQEAVTAMSAYGEGSALLNVVGSPKPPAARRAGIDIGSDEPTL